MSIEVAEPIPERGWLDDVLAAIDEGVCIVGGDGCVLAANRGFAERLAVPSDMVDAGRAFADVTRHLVERGDLCPEQVARLMVNHLPPRGGARSVEHRIAIGGRRLVVDTRPLCDGGMVQVCRELPDEAVRSRDGDLRAYADKLERSNRELQDFASIASHDLQEPLRKIEAFGQRLQARCGDELGDAGRMYVDRMQNAAARMRILIEDLLTYSRVSTKAKPFEAIDLGTIAREVLSDLQVTIEQAEARIDLGSLPTIDADPTQMRQLFQNLLTNALKFHRAEAAPVIRIDGRALAFDDGSAARCEVRVADDGIGFEPKYAERIFGIFQRLHGRSAYEGTGIGLATCRKIVERHGGTIVATSIPGRGATFTVTLPICQATGDAE